MVLKIGRAGLLVVALLSGCVGATEPVRSGTREGVAVGLVLAKAHDPGVLPAPAELSEAIAAALDRRNFAAAVTAGAPAGLRDRARRFEALAAAGGEAPWLLLVEAEPVYFGQIAGRIRWEVTVRASLQRRGDPSSLRESRRTYPALLDHVHEAEPEALRAVAGLVAEQVGALVDEALAAASPVKSASLGPQRALYFALVDRMPNGDVSNDRDVAPADPAAWHGGDLKGVTQRLDAMAALGVDALWLSPLSRGRAAKFEGHGAFHGYWVEELAELDPRFGSEAELQGLIAAAHARGIRVYVDLVLNHVDYDAKLVKAKPEWFHRNGPIVDWNDPVQLVTHEVHGLPDLAQERPEVHAALVQAAKAWIARGVDGFRLDAVKHVDAGWWRRFGDEVRAGAPDGFYLLGEDLEGDPGKLADRWGKTGFDAVFDFPLHFALLDVVCSGAPPARLAALLAGDAFYDAPERLVTLADNHDLPRLASRCADERDGRAVLELLAALRGTPSISWGTESALPGGKEPENRGDLRPDHEPWRESLTAALARRAAWPALRGRYTQVLASDASSLLLARGDGQQAALVFLNRGEAPRAPALPEALAAALVIDAPREVPAHGVGLFRLALRPGGSSSPLLAALAGRPAELPITVEVQGLPPLAAGERLHLTGAGPALGGWIPQRGPVIEAGLVTLVLPRGTLTEGKLVRVRPDGQVTWEGGENVPIFAPAAGPPAPLRLTWRGA